MNRLTEICEGMKNLFAWRQNYDTSTFEIAGSLTVTETGRYYQDVHPLITLENIKAIAPEFKRITHSAWLIGSAYLKGAKVTADEVNYRAKRDNTGVAPATLGEDWETFDPFSEWLEQKTKSSIMKAIQAFWDEKLAESSAKNILESKTLFTGTGRFADTVEETANLVGLEIVPIRADGVTTRLDRIGLQFTGVGGVEVHLMHSSRKVPLKTQTFTRTRDSGMEWFDLTGWNLPYVSSEVDAGGSWYLAYDQSVLPEGVRAINKNRDWSSRPCLGCNDHETANQRIWSKYLEIHPFKTADFTTGAIVLGDVEKNVKTYENNYGINLQVTIECDMTDIFIQQKKSFQSIIGYQVAADMLREFAYNPQFNINRNNQNFNKIEILYELDGSSDSYKRTGLIHLFNKAMKSTVLDATKMSRICTPCGKKGIKFRSM
jgi:hypothetical protein